MIVRAYSIPLGLTLPVCDYWPRKVIRASASVGRVPINRVILGFAAMQIMSAEPLLGASQSSYITHPCTAGFLLLTSGDIAGQQPHAN
jgi:hypothetical protein